MALNKKDITLLCKVVDNYGDIGFVYRLARRLSELDPALNLRLIISNLESFAAMAPGINPSESLQYYSPAPGVSWKILDWNAGEECTKEYTENKPHIVLECFQCGRPDWFENILFSDTGSNSGDLEDFVQIVNVEYLTAEEWADDFHLLKGGTRSRKVRKINFMPGFTAKTGGLVLDNPFMQYLKDKKLALEALKPYLSSDQMQLLLSPEAFNVTAFSYERDYTHFVKALEGFQKQGAEFNQQYRVNVFAASGLSFEPLMASYKANNATFNVIKLPYLPQNAWDALLTLMNFNFIRGEDSFARACLCGVPFMWHVYVQEEEFQLVKLEAFLKRLKPFMDNKLYGQIHDYAMLYNRNYSVALGEEAQEVWSELDCSCGEKEAECCMEEMFSGLLMEAGELKKAFEKFSENLISNGDLAENLLEYVKGI